MMSRQVASCVLLAILVVSSTVVFGQPDFSIEPSSLDFGRVEPKELSSLDVIITNNGSAPLQILQIEAKCGCTVPDLENNTIPPGESTPLTINYLPKGGDQGEELKIIHIHTNDPDLPSYELYVKAFVYVSIEIEPISKRVGFATSDHDTEESKQIKFRSQEQPKLEIEIDRFKKDLFKLKIDNNFEGDPQLSVLTVTKPRGMAAGDHKDIFRLRTNVKDMPTIDIECRARVEHELKLSRRDVNFRYVKEGQQLRNKIRVAPASAHKGLEYKITGAEIDIPGLKARVEETIVNRETLVHIEGKALYTTSPEAIAAKGRLSGTLRIFTNLPELPEMQVKISYMLKM